MRRIVFVVLVVLAVAPVAFAAAPTKVEQSLHRSAPNFIQCPGFTVAGDWNVDRTVFTYYDANGNPSETVFHVHFAGMLTDTATGKSIPDQGNQIVRVDLATGVTTIDGRIRTDTAPADGVILAQTGKLVLAADGSVLFAAGQHDLQNGFPDGDGFCAYMASL